MESAALLEKLVAFRTESAASNLDLIVFVESFLAGRGIPSRRFPDASGRKANLFATIGPAQKPGILLSGHTDVVPTDGQAWASDPFVLNGRNSRLYGRGAADMKGFLACALRAADLAARRNLAIPLHLALSYDEEIGCVGVRGMLDVLAAEGTRPMLAIIGEPTSMQIATGHKGKLALRATCCGLEAHSALATRGLNAIHLATDLVTRLRERQNVLMREGGHDSDYAIACSTIHVGRISGGTALNIVPNRCILDFEIRNVAQDDPSAILAGIFDDAAAITAASRRQFPQADVRLEVVNDYPGLATERDSEAVAFVASLLNEPTTIKVDFGTEGGLFRQRLRVPVVICGPGSMEQGHKADEFVSLDQLQQCDAMMERLVDRLEG